MDDDSVPIYWSGTGSISREGVSYAERMVYLRSVAVREEGLWRQLESTSEQQVKGAKRVVVVDLRCLPSSLQIGRSTALNAKLMTSKEVLTESA